MGNKFAFKVIVILSVLLGNNSVFGQSNSATKELEEKVAALEKKVEYLELIQALNQIQVDNMCRENSVSIHSNELKYDIFNNYLSADLIYSNETLYKLTREGLEITKSKLETIEEYLNLMLLQSYFSDREVEVLMSNIISSKANLCVLEESLKLLEYYISQAKKRYNKVK